jgi:2-methylcitrate dehydratase PrpD
MMNKVHVNVITGGYEDKGGEFRRRTTVTVTRRDGSRIERTEDWPLGSLRNPMTPSHILQKYTECAQRVLDEAQIGRSIDALHTLETTSIRDLVGSITVAGR